MRIGYLECFSGISGDMLLGALVDAGVPFSLLEETTTALNVGARLEMRKVTRGGLAGTKVDVVPKDEADGTMILPHHTPMSHAGTLAFARRIIQHSHDDACDTVHATNTSTNTRAYALTASVAVENS